ncbi:DUF4351 domain-containing protein [Thioflexithrix psekupsensis]|uniref:DUF4351 domain-containing protein n=1 Tax=Thioflexithrix psekupsensis TaxID=1570016 RepID=A0A251X866_9GAMM|nr:DUF4351 domain-containing protein [Thioflexithrix psekupsensis]OUD13560.1 hypothetical protein TPSD3_10250 [Thioflexithrix psekupsensis]
MDTQAGQDIYHMGMTEGERDIFMRQLKKRFGKLSYSVESKIENATSAQLEQWVLNILDAKTLEDVFQD